MGARGKTWGFHSCTTRSGVRNHPEGSSFHPNDPPEVAPNARKELGGTLGAAADPSAWQED